ncbi:dihydroneopterin aldolase [Streptomyces sp. NPDC020800]|uniref:dihydroneopterin aldolase n=1 Tax=Streptomyces sp. NPDC020800 TaxID=3365092 RepID=UPI00378BCCCE
MNARGGARPGARDLILLTGLRTFGHHGVGEAERTTGQVFVVDAVLEVDTRPAALTDDVSETVDWHLLAQRIDKLVTGSSFRLVETLAASIADECLADALVAAVEVTVRKPHAPIPLAFDEVAVRIRRDREPLPGTGEGQ